jgi:hypothetical protein
MGHLAHLDGIPEPVSYCAGTWPSGQRGPMGGMT